MSWCFGQALDKAGHQLAFSPEGSSDHLLLSTYFVSKAPTLPRWEFWPAKQGESCSGHSLDMDNAKLAFDDVMVALRPNMDRQMPDLHIYHAEFAKMDEDMRARFTFIMLDEVLGELGTGAWLAAIESETEPLSEAFPLPSLMERVTEFYELMEWSQPGAGPGWSSYRLKADPASSVPRADCLGIISRSPDMIRAFIHSQGQFDDPMLAFGAAYVYLALPRAWFAQEGDELEQARAVTEALEAVLQPDLGSWVGRGFSPQWYYLDFLIFDGENSLQRLRETAAELGLPANSELLYLDQNLRARGNQL